MIVASRPMLLDWMLTALVSRATVAIVTSRAMLLEAMLTAFWESSPVASPMAIVSPGRRG